MSKAIKSANTFTLLSPGYIRPGSQKTCKETAFFFPFQEGNAYNAAG
ncbi:hypothetical protein MTY_0538 [Moorella thermoacetica Y72]|uniref:Uncharacterized protein n=1 Tax=Moorella thermoacetica Y72 TaxID=1325331 RepID=A0A0S6UBB8_NEOTH|nr:hypothetical protein MTY_0538 [Moorella thermoacetica Y72]